MSFRERVVDDGVPLGDPFERDSTEYLSKLRPATGGHQTHANLAATQLCSYWNLGVVDALDAVAK